MARTKKVETITKISPHTVKKFELIEKYVDEWARKILGFNGVNGLPGSKGVIYIDCMCNSGVYEVDGKLVEGTALRVAKSLMKSSPIIPERKQFFFSMICSLNELSCYVLK